ncbi:hypothetical protein [uncultured Sunxiuqinia sp.]|jgi:hypothetical protein|uniref:hypothetical protein n=1 Tax=uncultured Sunxiuqinia sp. TaxID=1573825 RepID=UPI0030DD412E
MPMMKNYTLIYFIHAHPSDQFAPLEIDLSREKEVSMDSELSELLFSPSEKSVQEILNFSRSYEVLDSNLTAHIEVIKN